MKMQLGNSKKILTIVLFFLSMNCVAQSDSTENKNSITYTGAVIFERQTMGEVGINFGKLSYGGSCGGGGFMGFRLSSEFAYYHDHTIAGPKVGYENYIGPIGLRVSVVDYTGFKMNDIRLVPEAGFTTGAIELYYGRNISLSDQQFNFIANNRFSIIINIDPKHLD